MKFNLKDDEGNIITVDEDDCYPPDEQGYYMVCLRKYSYFIGKKTKKKANRSEKDIDRDY
jgi:hypothetical protein